MQNVRQLLLQYWSNKDLLATLVKVTATLNRFQIAQVLQWLGCGLDNLWQASDSSVATVTRLWDGQHRDLNSSPGKTKPFPSSPIHTIPFILPLRLLISRYLGPSPRGQSKVVSRWPLPSTAADNNTCNHPDRSLHSRGVVLRWACSTQLFVIIDCRNQKRRVWWSVY